MSSPSNIKWSQEPGLELVQNKVFTYLKIQNATGLELLRNITAPSFVGSPTIRGTTDILWSCVITLVACLYTALHLNVPVSTKVVPMLKEKLKWVVIGLVAPEFVLYLALSQFLDARHLSKQLTILWRQQHEVEDDSIPLNDIHEAVEKEVSHNKCSISCGLNLNELGTMLRHQIRFFCHHGRSRDRHKQV